MRGGMVHPFASRVPLWGVLLGVWGLLAGCAADGAAQRTWGTPEGSGYRGAPIASRQSRVLRAMGESPSGSGESTGQVVQGYTVPGRNPDSQAPWQFFLGNAAHRLIAYMYGVNHPQNEVFYNHVTLLTIVTSTGVGSPAQLLEEERNLRPDITDITALMLFEIKPSGEQNRQEGRQEAQVYLAALNRAAAPGVSFAPGTNCQGEILIRFAQGQYIWRLEWQTTEPGVVQYRWTRSQQRFESAAEASEAGQWVTLSEQELRQFGGWVGHAVEDMVHRREQLASFSGAVGLVIDIIGEGARGILTGAILGRMSSGSGVQQPPGQSGGKVIPFPSRALPEGPAARLPAAAGR